MLVCRIYTCVTIEKENINSDFLLLLSSFLHFVVVTALELEECPLRNSNICSGFRSCLYLGRQKLLVPMRNCSWYNLVDQRSERNMGLSLWIISMVS
uniref:Uncharacterized protein n=1 Tax=Rhizophora mucronata TaxID=61149 RepID=A0A2P2JY73_RHIMU